MAFVVDTQAQGVAAHHRTGSAEFWSTEARLDPDSTKPNPLELLLGSLTGCMTVVMQMIAREQGWTQVEADYHVQGALDPRGLMGDPSVAPYFHTVTLAVQVRGVPKDQGPWLQKEVGRRCPVHRLLEAAGVHLSESWQFEPATAR
ncbi:MAG: OsmC family protein [Firmicutes bacterium]|nr:OsmC family protein [Bacillota bacterium]